MVNFSVALTLIKRGQPVKRAGWPPERWIMLHHFRDKMCLHQRNGGFLYLWVPSSEELLADDWELVRREKDG